MTRDEIEALARWHDIMAGESQHGHELHRRPAQALRDMLTPDEIAEAVSGIGVSAPIAALRKGDSHD